MSVYDCLLFSGFSGESDLLELRLHELDGAVDRHVIVEARQTFQGAPHVPVFPTLRDRLRPFLSRIDYHLLDLPESDVYPRAPGGRERFHRDALATRLPAGGHNDIVIISDADEIPRGALLRQLTRTGWINPVQLGMTPYYLHMNLQIVSDISEAPLQRKLWNGSLLVRRGTLEVMTPYQLRDIPGRSLVPDGGWHFSTLGGVEAIQAKLAAWGHPEKNCSPYNDTAHLERCLREGRDWDVDRVPPMELRWVELDSSYPAYVREHPDLFAQYMGQAAGVRP